MMIFPRSLDDSWKRAAVCASVDPELFFPEDQPAPIRETVGDAAVRLCGTCPVRIQCLDEAIAEERGSGVTGRHGIRGGKTPRARRAIYEARMRRARAAAEQPPAAA